MANYSNRPSIYSKSIKITGNRWFIPIFRLDILDIMREQKEIQVVLLGRRIRTLRTQNGWTQEELGDRADINYKFLGEIERGQQNPSFGILTKIASALRVDLPELFRFEHETANRVEIENRISRILKDIPDEDLSRIFLIFQVLFPAQI
jgi:transcriptional regulator with XRE-family HTH domain